MLEALGGGSVIWPGFGLWVLADASESRTGLRLASQLTRNNIKGTAIFTQLMK